MIKFKTMEVVQIKDDIQLIGFQVRDFPVGIAKAFEELRKVRSFYPVLWSKSRPEDHRIVYRAGIAPLTDNEASELGYESFIIPKGNYLTLTIEDWQDKLHLIQQSFDLLIEDPRVHPQGFCVECYENDRVMKCTVTMK